MDYNRIPQRVKHDYTMIEKEIERRKLKVVQVLFASSTLTRAQLTMGPLRHANQKMRNRVLSHLLRDNYLEEKEVRPPNGGPVGKHYCLTEAGRKYYQATSDLSL